MSNYCDKCGKRMMLNQHKKTGICWDCYVEKNMGIEKGFKVKEK